MSFVKSSVIHDPCESVRYDDQILELLNKKGKAGIGYDRPESSKSGWLKNRLDKEKAKAGSKSFVQNQQRRDSKKVKYEWKKDQISPSVPAAGAEVTNAQDAQTDVAQADSNVHIPTSEVPIASTSYQVRLLLADVAFSARVSERATRVGQHFEC
ncbi:hypothetical protein F511_28297 [Dorcoceras hygrometricum]|uniref:Uncharacterized protein n=1 Tax=Dorcoceras hygrometricum TaxID=472368 RepID=A0A2Z7A3S9_9LAMI|nr:hypothetical protein F511_28297 [Dorcoceras hygrometricum]